MKLVKRFSVLANFKYVFSYLLAHEFLDSAMHRHCNNLVRFFKKKGTLWYHIIATPRTLWYHIIATPRTCCASFLKFYLSVLDKTFVKRMCYALSVCKKEG